MVTQEIYSAVPIAANGTLNLAGGGKLGGFIADVAGTLTLTLGGTAVLTAIPVAAGVFVKLPFGIPTAGASTIVLAGGAKGAAAVSA